MKPLNQYLPIITLLVGFAIPAHAEGEASRFEAADSQGVTAMRAGNMLLLEVEESVQGPITIPRLAAPVRQLSWEAAVDSGGLQLKPEPEHWVMSWKNRPQGGRRIVLSMDSPPRLISEVKPIEATGDGSFYLPAHFAVTRGHKLRYEPQSFKNTVGYWGDKQDTATWTIHLAEPGRFSVAILQGCGKGKGGSTATMTFIGPVKDISPTIEFEVVETGHFQNFRWVHVGECELRHPGKIEVVVAPEQIQASALMDIRAIHLIRLPNK